VCTWCCCGEDRTPFQSCGGSFGRLPHAANSLAGVCVHVAGGGVGHGCVLWRSCRGGRPHQCGHPGRLLLRVRFHLHVHLRWVPGPVHSCPLLVCSAHSCPLLVCSASVQCCGKQGGVCVGGRFMLLALMPIGGMYDTWTSGSDFNSLCCYGLVYLLDSWEIVFEKPNRSSFTFT
jgi:hypothetical protein